MARSTQLPTYPQVLIVGAGIGGVMMGLMLDRAGISYLILERSEESRPVGSAISLGPTVMRVLEQLGLLSEIEEASKPVQQIRHFDDMEGDMKEASIADMSFSQRRYGRPIRVIPRSTLHTILRSRLPTEKVLMGKRVVLTWEHDPENDHGINAHVLCRCDDGSLYGGSILVGADGSYSTVRTSMYKNMVDSGVCHANAFTTMAPQQYAVVGITEPLDPIEFASLGSAVSEIQVLRGPDEKHIWLMPLPGYRIAWNLFCNVPQELLRDYQRNTQSKGNWRTIAEKVHVLGQWNLQELRHVRNPLSAQGGTFGELVDQTMPEMVSRVTMETGVYDTWYFRRTVLIGDACHKTLPYGGQGANQAILDGICLVNQIHQMTLHRTEDYETTFQEYQRLRSDLASYAMVGSGWYGSIFGGCGWILDLIRKFYFRSMPGRMLYLFTDPIFRVRPVLSFLPVVEDQGPVGGTYKKDEAPWSVVQTILQCRDGVGCLLKSWMLWYVILLSFVRQEHFGKWTKSNVK